MDCFVYRNNMSAVGQSPSDHFPFRGTSSFINSLTKNTVLHDHITKQQLAGLLENRLLRIHLKMSWKEMIMLQLTY